MKAQLLVLAVMACYTLAYKFPAYRLRTVCPEEPYEIPPEELRNPTIFKAEEAGYDVSLICTDGAGSNILYLAECGPAHCDCSHKQSLIFSTSTPKAAKKIESILTCGLQHNRPVQCRLEAIRKH